MGISSFIADLQKSSRHARSTSEQSAYSQKQDEVRADNFETHHDTGSGETDIGHSIPAWHVHGSPATSRPSTATAPKQQSHITRPSMDDARYTEGQAGPEALASAVNTQTIPHRSSSLRSVSKDDRQQQQNQRSNHRPELDRIDSERMPRDGPDGVPSQQTGTESSGQINSDSKPLSLNHKLPRKPLNPESEAAASPSIMNDQLQQRSLATSTQEASSQHLGRSSSKKAAHVTDQMKLPPGFDLNDSVQTDVKTAWQPAVTREVVYHNTHEVRQEVITRDIHVHHYYTYIQPIKVVEVLPAKHYTLDAVTGAKVEIPAPAGWQMPPSMTPHAPDTSSIKAATRHYLVNDQYPNGVPELAPEDDRRDTPQKARGYHDT